MRRLNSWVFALACAGAALAPCLPRARTDVAPRAAEFTGWPMELEGERLEPLPAGAREGAFFRAFGGEVGRFRLGERELVLRWIPSPTRHVHPAHHCFASSGYEVSTPKPVRDAEGQLWSSFEARRSREHLLVRENLVDADGRSFADVSSWYWSAVTGSSRGPWWARTIAVVAQ